MADRADREAFKRAWQEASVEGVELAAIDWEAVSRWMERNPNATPEELRQVAMAPDHVLDTTEDEEAR